MNIHDKNIQRINIIQEKHSKYQSNRMIKYNDYSSINTIVTEFPLVPYKSFNLSKIRYKSEFIGKYLRYNPIKNKCILNFASAKHPGGGVLKGSIAQEEDICRNTLLYSQLEKFKHCYDYGQFKGKDYFYNDFIIYTNNIPTVYANLNLSLHTNSFITSAAPNLKGIKNVDKKKYRFIMRRRIESVFATAYQFNEENLVLGPWGCGVFKNDPILVAFLFKEVIANVGGHFKTITFLIPDKIMLDIFKLILQND